MVLVKPATVIQWHRQGLSACFGVGVRDQDGHQSIAKFGL
jgi:hypothetical protein